MREGNISSSVTVLLPRVGDEVPRWPLVDVDLPPVAAREGLEGPSLYVLERVLEGLRAL